MSKLSVQAIVTVTLLIFFASNAAHARMCWNRVAATCQIVDSDAEKGLHVKTGGAIKFKDDKQGTIRILCPAGETIAGKYAGMHRMTDIILYHEKGIDAYARFKVTLKRVNKNGAVEKIKDFYTYFIGWPPQANVERGPLMGNYTWTKGRINIGYQSYHHYFVDVAIEKNFLTYPTGAKVAPAFKAFSICVDDY
jgi:hypothetical protein